MESALYYNVIFAPKVVKKPSLLSLAKYRCPDGLLESIQQLPTDVANHIGTFFNSRETLGMAQLNRLYEAQAKIVSRSADDWLQKWSQGKAHFLPPLVKICAKTIKMENATLKKDKVFKFCLDFARQLNCIIDKCVVRSRPKPFYKGQTFTDLKGIVLVADWFLHKDADWLYDAFNGRPYLLKERITNDIYQGCERKELRWVRY